MYKWYLLSATLSAAAMLTAGVTAQIPDGYEIVHVTDNPNDYSAVPRINACGEIVFSTRINQSESLEEIFLYDNGRLSQLTDNTIRDAFPDINDKGTVVWTQGADGFGGRFLDLDHDRDVDWVDFGIFQTNYTGAN